MSDSHQITCPSLSLPFSWFFHMSCNFGLYFGDCSDVETPEFVIIWTPHRVLQPSPYFSHCLSLSHRPRLPGLLRSGLALDAGEGEHCGWGRGRGLAGTACRWAWAPARGICALRAQDDCPGSCRGPQSWLLPRSTARSAPTPRGPLWLSLSPQSPHSRPVPASTAPADTRFLPRCLTRTWRLVGSQDRNVVATQGGLTAPEQS